jgi:hypothetical protein
MFGITALPGNKLINGSVYGIAEAVASFAIGFLCKFAPDNLVFIGLTTVCLISNVAYYFLGGGHGGPFALMFYFLIVFSIGGMMTCILILIELRVPGESLAASMVIIYTSSVFLSAISPTIAYLS